MSDHIHETASIPVITPGYSEFDAERMLDATRSALAADADLLEPEQGAEIDRLLGETDAIRTSSADAATIEAATEALAKGTEAFAAMRMNRGIARALSGKNVENF